MEEGVAPLAGVRAELGVVHAVEFDDRRVRRKDREPTPIGVAVEHDVGAPGDAQRRDGRRAVGFAVGGQQHQAVDALRVATRVPAGHRSAERVPADEPPVDVGVRVDHLVGGGGVEHCELERHLGDVHRDVRSSGQRRQRFEVRVGGHVATGVEHERGRRLAVRGFQRVHAVAVGHLDAVVRADGVDGALGRPQRRR